MSFLKLQGKQKLPSIKNIKFFKEKSLQNKYFYFDFQNQQNIITLQKQTKEKVQDQEIQIIGKNYITNLSRLPQKTFKLVRYLSQSKVLTEKRKQIEKLLTTKKRALLNKSEFFTSKAQKNQNKSQFSHRMSPNILLQYLENRQNNKILKNLHIGQNQLVQSISSITQISNAKRRSLNYQQKVESNDSFLKRMNFPQYFRNSKYFMITKKDIKD